MNTTAPSATLSGERTTSSKTFDSVTLKIAQDIVGTRKEDQAEINRLFYNGDHWQTAKGWVGPHAGDASDPVGAATLKAIEAAFVSRNVIAELTRRHVDGVLGRELHWKFSVKRELEMVEVVDEETGATRMERAQPSEEEQRLIDEAEAALVEWWDARQTPEILQNALAAMLNTKRGVLRMFVPTDLRDEQGSLPSGDLAACLNYVWLQHLGTDDDTLDLQFPNATVYTHKNSRRQVGLFTYEETEELVSALLVSGQVGKPRAEVTYLADDGQTVLRVLDDQADVEEPVVMPLGGRLTMYEMVRPWLITPQIVSQQKLLNMTMTMKQRNAVLGGFLERIFLNVQWPGNWVGEGAARRFVPDPVQVGPGYMTNLQGVEFTDAEGKPHIANPSVNYRDPVSPGTFIETEMSAYLAMLQEAQQLHYALAGDSVVSGESRKQARDAFRQDLQFTGGKVEAAARWVLETALAMGAYFAGRPGAFDGLRVYVQARVDSGPVSPDDMRVAAEMKEKELWSKETAQSATGIEDVDAENQRIDKERAEESKRDAENMARAQKLMDEINPPDEGREEGGGNGEQGA